MTPVLQPFNRQFIGLLICSLSLISLLLTAGASANTAGTEGTLPSASFASATASVSENAGTVMIAVALSSNTPTALNIPFVVGGSASPGTDHNLMSASLMIPANSDSGAIAVDIVDDGTIEADETLIVMLVAGSGYNLGSPSSHTLTILDNDGACTAPELALPGDFTVVESVQPVTVPVTLINTPSLPVTVHYELLALSGGTVAMDSINLGSIQLPILPQGAYLLTVFGTSNDGCDGPPVATGITVVQESPSVGLALQGEVNGTAVTLNLVVENLGNVDVAMVNVALDLDAAFGMGNYAVVAGPSNVSGTGTLMLDMGYDGSGTSTIASGALGVGQTQRINVTVNLNNIVDLGSGLGVYHAQASIMATAPSTIIALDVSDAGLEPDSNHNANAADFGEDDPTVIILGEEPQIGVAKTAIVNEREVQLLFTIENLGNTALNQLSLIDDLAATFGAGNYATPVVSLNVDPGTIALDASYDGTLNVELIDGSMSSLAIGSVAVIEVMTTINTIVDQGLGEGFYLNQATVTGNSPGGAINTDFSDDGTDPDPNGNGEPDEAGENDPTMIQPVTPVTLMRFGVE